MPLPDIALVHHRYLALSGQSREPFAGTLAGELLLRLGFDTGGIATAIAASVAGAATLVVDADAEALRQGLRAGLCDFVVANLDEALRILKNEIRRGLPVSVCLNAEPEACAGAMAERGVQPRLLSLDEPPPLGALRMLERGAVRLTEDANPEPGTSLLRWTLTSDAARTMPRLAAIALDSLDSAGRTTPARRRWLEASPRYLGRAFGWQQCVRVTPDEANVFVERVRAEVPAAAIVHEKESAS